MSIVYSYIRLTLTSWLFIGGVALQFFPSNAAVGREARWRERQLQAIPPDRRAEWIENRDTEYGRSEAAVRVFGVLMAGIGLGRILEPVRDGEVRRLVDQQPQPVGPPPDDERRPTDAGGWNAPHS